MEGNHIPLTSVPSQCSSPPTPHFSSEDMAVLEEETQSLLQKQVICQIHSPAKGFYSNMFIIPKKDGGQRPVINLKYLNKHVKSEHFKMEGLHTIKALWQRFQPNFNTFSSSRWKRRPTSSFVSLSACAQHREYSQRYSSQPSRC